MFFATLTLLGGLTHAYADGLPVMALVVRPGALNSNDQEGPLQILQAAEQHQPIEARLQDTRNDSTGVSLKVRVGAKSVWVNQNNLTPTRVNGSFQVRTDASNASNSLGALKDAELIDDIVITGRTKPSLDNSGNWYEVIFEGHPGWVNGKALGSGGLPPVAPAGIAAAGAPPKPTVASGPACISSYGEALQSPRFRSLVQQSNPFTTWKCDAVGASVSVSSSGQAVLHHPLKGDIPMFVSLCVDGSNRPYVNLNGGAFSQKDYFNGPDMSSLSITDHDSNQSYTFTRASR